MGILGHVLHLLSVHFTVLPLLVVRDALVNNFFKFGGCRLLGTVPAPVSAQFHTLLPVV